LITTSTHRLVVKTVKTAIRDDGAEPSFWYSLNVSASPNEDGRIAPFYDVGGCCEILEEIESLRDWLQVCGITEVEEVYTRITHLI
jgi:hypothetical protein